MEKRGDGPGVVGSGCGCCDGTGLRVVGVEMEAMLATGRRRLRTETAGVGVIVATVAVGMVDGGEGGGLCW